jgi:hypothetical protein
MSSQISNGKHYKERRQRWKRRDQDLGDLVCDEGGVFALGAGPALGEVAVVVALHLEVEDLGVDDGRW